MNEAYAKVYQNLQERFDSSKYDLTKPMGGLSQTEYNALDYRERENIRRRSNVNNMNTTAKEVNLDKKTGEKVTIEKGEVTDRKSSANNNNQQSTQSNNNNQQSNNNQSSGNNADAPKGGGSYKFKPGEAKALGDKLRSQSGDKVQSNNQTSQGSGQPSGNQSGGGQQPQSGVNRSQTVVKDGNKTTTTTKTSADDSTPEGAAAVKDFKTNRAERLNRLRSGGGLRPDGEGPSTGGTPPLSTQSGAKKPATGGQPPSGGQKPGLLGRLGSLAGKAVGAARNVAGNVKQGAQAVAGGIKQGAQAVAGALANKGPIQGRQTGAQRRAQQTGQPAPQTQQAKPAPQAQPAPQVQQAKPVPQAQPAQQAKPVQAAPAPKPVPQAQPAQQQQSQRPSPMERRNARLAAAKSKGNPLKRPGAQKAMQMAKARLAAKNAPINASYDLFDDTVQFLVSEGHAKDASEAMSIMSESEFIDAFNQELNG